MLTFWGLTNCDTCRKARKQLEGGGVPFTFRDIRESPPEADLILTWIDSLGRDAILNKRSTTWRALSESERAGIESDEGAAKLMAANPTLIKRPILEDGTRVTAGWSAKIAENWGL
ncbi:Spx/MgsR family RNA polymerase-binding regulatory protein [Paracoccaceae bacterium GXU_MW_L88]